MNAFETPFKKVAHFEEQDAREKAPDRFDVSRGQLDDRMTVYVATPANEADVHTEDRIAVWAYEPDILELTIDKPLREKAVAMLAQAAFADLGEVRDAKVVATLPLDIDNPTANEDMAAMYVDTLDMEIMGTTKDGEAIYVGDSTEMLNAATVALRRNRLMRSRYLPDDLAVNNS